MSDRSDDGELEELRQELAAKDDERRQCEALVTDLDKRLSAVQTELHESKEAHADLNTQLSAESEL